ncbi:MAG: hypothetical protein R3F46_00815 [bacterium]
MKKYVISSFLAVMAVFALLGSASAASIGNSVNEAVAAVNMQIDTVSVEVAHCGTCGMGEAHAEKPMTAHADNCGCGCKSKCGCSKPKCGCSKPKCGCEKPKCGCSKPKCGCEKKCGCSKPKCCDKPKCGCEKKCGCKDPCECCPKKVENYPDANRGAEGEWARDGLSRQRA